ncbi:MAG TPA: hypothetical protein VIL65_05510 [Beijerinckiaceae bacterium]|jgi:hypothetical protein
MPNTIQPNALLRGALVGDAAASGATGLLLLTAAGPLSGLLGLPAELLRFAGLILVPYAVFVLWAGTRPSLRRGLVLTIVALNAIWVVDSLALLASGWVTPTGLGTAFVIAQALVVGVFAEAQFIGLRRSSAPHLLAA